MPARSNAQKENMKAKRSWKWLLGLGLATAICVSAMAQGGRGDHRKRHGGWGKRHIESVSKGELSDKIYRITGADSLQKQKMKPAVDRATKRLESLRLNYQKQEKRVLDSLSLQIKPYLKEEQIKKLTDWQSRTHR